jgi:hypothetical protein
MVSIYGMKGQYAGTYTGKWQTTGDVNMTWKYSTV